MHLRTGTVCVVGSLNADLVVHTERHPAPGETVTGGPLSVIPGGKSANQAVAAARLGATVSLVGAVGDDPHGHLLRDCLGRDGVNTEHVHTLPGTPTGTAMVTVSSQGENTIVVSPGTNGELHPEHVPDTALQSAGAVGLTFEIPERTVLTTAQRARAHGVPVFLNPSPFHPPEPELLACTDVLVMNEHEFEQVLGKFGIPPTGTWQQKATPLHAATGVGAFVITLGSQGALVIESIVEHRSDHSCMVTEVPGYAIQAVDTTGCGDAVLGCLLAAVSGGMTLIEATAAAMKVAAYAATRPGAQPSYPTPQQLVSNIPDQINVV